MGKRTLKLFALTASIGMILVMFFSGTSGAYAATADKRLEPLNPEFIKYKENRSNGTIQTRTAEGYLLNGTVPPTVSLSHVKGTLDAAVNDVQYPAQYDMRGTDRVVYVKNQSPYPTCWTFAAYTSLESCLLPDEEVDFSEWHLALNHGFDYQVEDDEAGTSIMTTAYLVRWSGPITEHMVPYNTGGHYNIEYTPAKHIQQVTFLPEREHSLDNNTIKYFMMNHGPVDFAYFYETSAFDSANNSLYYPSYEGQNHRLCIVGWDDNFSADRFGFKPPGNGAFIIRNSWGDLWADGGHAYLSYYDPNIQQMICFNNAEPYTNYGTVYQHDWLGFVSRWGFATGWGANIFTAENSQPLEAVGFYATQSNINYEIYIYKNTTVNNPVSGTLAATRAGGFIYPGYYTVKLDEMVPINEGERFSVVVKFQHPEKIHTVPLEVPISNHSSQAVANPNESFLSNDGLEWDDSSILLNKANVCIKAYAKYKKPIVSMQAERRDLRGWLVYRSYGKVTLNVENPDDVAIDKYIIYRSVNGTEFAPIREISPGEMQNNSFTFQDKYLDRDVRYIYQAAAVEPNGLIHSKSVMAAI